MKKSILIGGALLAVVIIVYIYIYNKNKKAAAGATPVIATPGTAPATLMTNATGATVVATPATNAGVVMPATNTTTSTPANALANVLGSSPSKVVSLAPAGTGISGIKSNGQVMSLNHFSTAASSGKKPTPVSLNI